MRVDPQNLPEGITKKWRGAGFAGFGVEDFGNAFSERGESTISLSKHGITGFAVVSGDRHSFWAGLAAKALPPKEFKPVGLAFVTGSLSSPGMVEAYEHNFPKNHPLRGALRSRRQHAPEHGVSIPAWSMLAAAMPRKLASYRIPIWRPTFHSSIWADMATPWFGRRRIPSRQNSLAFRGRSNEASVRWRATELPGASSAKLWAKGESPKLKLDVLEVIRNCRFEFGRSHRASAVVPPPCGRPHGRGTRARQRSRHP